MAKPQVIEDEFLPEEVIEDYRDINGKKVIPLTKEQIEKAVSEFKKRGVTLTFPDDSHWNLELNFADMSWYYAAEQKALQEGRELTNTSWSCSGNFIIPIDQVKLAAAHLVNLKKFFRPFKDAQAKGK